MIVTVTYLNQELKLQSVTETFDDKEFPFTVCGQGKYRFHVEKEENETAYMFSQRIKQIAKKNLLILKLKSC